MKATILFNHMIEQISSHAADDLVQKIIRSVGEAGVDLTDVTVRVFDDFQKLSAFWNEKEQL